MAKFIKSIFQPSERRKSSHYEENAEEADFTPPLDERRKLSISRSGRMKAANKLRHSISLEIYRGETLQTIERPKSREYHVNTPPNLNVAEAEITKENKGNEIVTANSETSEQIKTPDEEIDNAFGIIDKS